MNLNELHIESNPKLLFMANSINNKGQSHKSYTIRIVNDQYNDEQLDQIFSNKSLRTKQFDCTYTIDSIQLNGILRIKSINKAYADGIFISGNGKLWDSLDNSNLRDYDWSAFDHTLTKANVLASETQGDYIYDLCDRGEFIEEVVFTEKTTRFDPGTPTVSSLARVDITERYPAISIKTIIETVLNQEGYGITWSDNVFNSDLDSIYLLYMEDNAIRNSKEWEKSAIFEAQGNYNHTDSGTSIETTFDINKKLYFATENYDNGDNYVGANNDNATSNVYTVPETGTYNIYCSLDLDLEKQALPTVANYFLVITIKNGITSIYSRTYDSTDLPFGGGAFVNYTEVIQTKPTKLTAGDTISIGARFYGEITHTSNWIMTLQQNTSIFYNQVFRYYGANSTVSLAELLPDIKALEFIGKVSNYLNLYSFYREETKILDLEHGRQEKVTVKDIDPVEVLEDVNLVQNFNLEFNTDKAAPPDDIYFDNSGFDESVIKFDFSRTLINDCVRLFGTVTPQIPVLWKDGDPLSWSDVIEPPKWKTKGNYRILKYTGQSSGNYYLTYGGISSSNEELQTDYVDFQEVDIVSFHRYDMELEGDYIELIARMELDKLYDQTYFKSPLYISGYGRYWLNSAELIKGDIYKLELIK